MNALLASRPSRVRTPAGFVAVALLFYLLDGAIAHSSAFTARPDLFAVAISLDLTLGVTFAYWMLVVRPGRAALRTVMPVFAVSVAAAALMLPAGYREFVHYIRYLGVPFEIAIVGLIIVAMRRTHRRLAAAGIELDVPERIHALLAQSLPYPRMAAAMATEFSLLFYALGSWRRTPFVAANAQAFSYHRRNSYALTLYTLLFASFVEMAAVHFLLRVFAPRVAIALLAVSIFGVFWLLGFVRAVQLRPILISHDFLHVRNGLLWTIDIPRSQIRDVSFGRVRAPAKDTPGYLRVVLGDPNVLVELNAPIVARGPFGATREVTQLGLGIDDVERFRAALTVVSR